MKPLEGLDQLKGAVKEIAGKNASLPVIVLPGVANSELKTWPIKRFSQLARLTRLQSAVFHSRRDLFLFSFVSFLFFFLF